MTTCREILAWCDDILQTAQFKDYAPNGLQIEGAEKIEKIVAAVTASRSATITGWKKQRIATLLHHNINMAGYHLPLDAHPELGNNAQLAKLMDWQTDYTCGEQNLLNIGRLKTPKTVSELTAEIAQKLGRTPTVVGNPQQTVSRAAWCTGGAQGFFQTAIDEGAEVYVTGEISEAQYHIANETGTVFVSAGHHATERYGIQALARALHQKFGTEIYFFDEQNPA